MLFKKNIAIDLGTSNTLVYEKSNGIQINEASMILVNKIIDEHFIISVGNEARKTLGRVTGPLVSVCPIKYGTIYDIDATKYMLSTFFNQIGFYKWFSKLSVLCTVSTGILDIEKKILKTIFNDIGISEIYFIEKSIATAVGHGLSIMAPVGNMVVDIGGGTTEISILSLGGIAYSTSMKIGGISFNKEIFQMIYDQYDLLIGEQTLENIKRECVSVKCRNDGRYVEVYGRDRFTGQPKLMKISYYDVCMSVKHLIDKITEQVRISLEEVSSDLIADVANQGILLVGGGSLVKGLENHISKSVQIPIIRAKDPMCCTVMGAGFILEKLNELKYLLSD